MDFLVAQTVKKLPAMQKTQVWSLGRKDPLEKGTATQSSIIAWGIPWTEEPGGLQSTGSQRFGHNWATNTSVNIPQFIHSALMGIWIASRFYLLEIVLWIVYHV